MRAALVCLGLAALAGAALAQPGAYSSDEGKFKVRFPGAPKVTEKTAETAVGDLTVHVATYANTDGNVYMVGYTDFPAAATRPENKGTLFDGIRDGATGKDGKASNEKDGTFGPDKLPMREFTVEKNKQRIKFRVILRANRVYQLAAIGTREFVAGKDAAVFFDSFEIDK
jgi:hypothetical protein